ncbi:hypothetical protein Porky_118 [Mycobacterium phage Porky]|uniref:Uncharacterized protein n=1 Tax=Mycobacterium phage Porky TaxID=2914015 RepID=B5A678_9CAUD|nr:hypothetical protein Porky_118 [Mycobacterium phage Porky]YP_008051742.1 hypothetical protein PBI_DUMBO_119 [Mycobacterium phage Dumbo]ASZ73603.1 hypothetical protein SEA_MADAMMONKFISH_118 [Mycobacterium phage MadamMonkfish]QGJ94435.1 hypothetical protein SEA_CHOSENONE_119 [Mycobacterium phage ChosenOne]QGJ95187.1 hypothetical protein SEA_ELITE2014_118 [Mycobacterium phage Elite2014]QGJ96131.1 hypothetical protein SEA_LILPICKLE_118 [Mycobacterium phage Lilpickle]WRQ08863.1 hypothetical pro
MGKHSADEVEKPITFMDMTLAKHGLGKPRLVRDNEDIRDKQLYATIRENRECRAQMIHSTQSLLTAGAWLWARGEKFDVKIHIPPAQSRP